MSVNTNMQLHNLNASQLDTKIALSKQWLYNTYLEKDGAYGWSTFEGRNVISEWGGTLDAVRALLITDESQSNTKIFQSLNWLKSRQQYDGGWKSWEIQNSIVESTSWVLLTLQAANELERNVHLLKGYEFLVKCQNVDSGWGSYEKDKSRTYPTLLAVWALSKSNREIATKGSNWLLNAINNDGGWGFNSKCQNSNVAMTSLVIYVLLANGYLTETSIKSRAVKWLFQHKQDNDLWEAVIEDWNSFIDEATGREFPCRTDYFSTSWAILALLEANVSIYDKRFHKSVISFINSQMSDGSWTFLRYDNKKYTWVVSNGLYALDKVKDNLLSSTSTRDFDISQTFKHSRILKCLLIVLFFDTIATIILLEYNFGLFSKALSIFLQGFNYLSQKVTNLFSFGKVEAGQIIVAIIGTVLGGIVLHRFTSKK